jgi:type I site-specific restriction endonuclease
MADKNNTKKDIVLFDLDGTLALIEHRQHHVKGPKKNWKAFFKACSLDEPNHPVITAANLYASNGYEVWIVSGRSSEVKKQTKEWLTTHCLNYTKLIMRGERDYTPDDTLKRSWLLDGTIPKDRVLCAYDDRSRVVNMWRAEGIACFQVAPGDF